MGNPNRLISLLPPKVREAIQAEMDWEAVKDLFEKPRKASMRLTKEQLEAIAETEKVSVSWSKYEMVLLKYVRSELVRGDVASARDFFGELFGGVNAKRTALTKLFAELFPDVMLHKEKTK